MIKIKRTPHFAYRQNVPLDLRGGRQGRTQKQQPTAP